MLSTICTDAKLKWVLSHLCAESLKCWVDRPCRVIQVPSKYLMPSNSGVELGTQLQYVPSISITKCQVTKIWSSCLWWHKQLCKPFLSWCMDTSQSFEDKKKSIWIPYTINMQPIRKLERLSRKMHESQP